MIHQMKELITRAGKKAYTLVMGRPNPAKLANFPEVSFDACRQMVLYFLQGFFRIFKSFNNPPLWQCDVFIYVSCAQTALLDSKEFLAPVITPFEAMLAFSRYLSRIHYLWLELLVNSTYLHFLKHCQKGGKKSTFRFNLFNLLHRLLQPCLPCGFSASSFFPNTHWERNYSCKYCQHSTCPDICLNDFIITSSAIMYNMLFSCHGLVMLDVSTFCVIFTIEPCYGKDVSWFITQIHEVTYSR